MRADPQLKGLAQLNTFTELHERSRTTPWGRPPGEWDEEDDLETGLLLAEKWKLLVKATSTLRQGVLMAAREHKFNPIHDLIKSQEWDGTPRLDHWLPDVFEIEDRPYTRLVGRCFLMGLVARAMQPGVKFDFMLILKGPQGIAKSGAFRVLGEPWYTDNAIRVGDKDSLMAMQLVWIAESAELESLNKAETTLIKQFLSAQEDMYRPPYGAQVKKRPRHTVMGGTTNADNFLKDASGDRRFWPLEVEVVHLDVLRGMRLQLFAEALHRLRAKEQYWPTREQEKELIFPEQVRFKKEERWEDYLDAYVNARTNDKHDDAMDSPRCHRDFFTSVELYDKALTIKADRIDGAGQMDSRIANAMKALGFVKHRETTKTRRRGWVRLPAMPPALSGHTFGEPPAGVLVTTEGEDDALPF
jgi:putative DNA primase/helicase